MNKIYKVIWSKVKNCYVVTSELAKSHGKGGTARCRSSVGNVLVTALLISLFEDCGTDSFAGRVASVLAGSSETTFYATAMYFGCVNVKNIRHTLFAALAADFAALVASVITVRLFFY